MFNLFKLQKNIKRSQSKVRKINNLYFFQLTKEKDVLIITTSCWCRAGTIENSRTTVGGKKTAWRRRKSKVRRTEKIVRVSKG